MGRNIFLVYLLTLITGISSYLVRILFARNLSLEEYGLFYAVLGTIFFFSFIRDLGLTETATFFLNKYSVKGDKKKLNQVFWMSVIPQLCFGIIIGLSFILLSNYLSIHFFKNSLAKPIIILVALLFSFHTLIPSISYLFYAIHNFVIGRLVNFLQMFSILVISYLCFTILPTHIKYMIPAVSYLLAYIIVITTFYFILFKKYPYFKINNFSWNKKLFNEMRNYAFLVLLSTGGTLLLTYSDTILLTLIRGVSAVGLYNIAWPCLNVILIFVGPITTMLLPIISRKYHSKDVVGIKKILSLIYNYILVFTLPLAILFFVFSPLIIKVLFGPKYLGATNTLRVFSLFFVFMALRDLNFSIIAGIGKPKERSIIMYYGAGFNIIMDLLLIPKFGATGAALATGLGFALMSYLTYRLIQKHYPVRVDWFLQLRVIIASLLFAVIIHWLKSVLNLNWILESIIVLSLSGIVYLLLLFLFRVLTKERFLMFKKLMFDY